MIIWSEPSGENRGLAEAEFASVVRAVGGRDLGPTDVGSVRILRAEVGDPMLADAVAGRLALSRRLLRPEAPMSFDEALAWTRGEGAAGRTASFRPFGRPTGGGSTPSVAGLGREYKAGGGVIDLESPTRRFWVTELEDGRLVLAEELGAPPPRSYADRRMPRLPFQRPVSLPPKLGRVAVNLAGLRPGERVVDPFVGTGALMLEAAIVGIRVSGGDRDPAMVRGALENLRAHGHDFEALRVGDAADSWDPPGGGRWDGIVTDPPYGRASGSAGESPEALVARALPAWAERVRSGGRIVVVLPGGPDPLPPPWRRTVSVAERVHRSLTREFRVYERGR